MCLGLLTIKCIWLNSPSGRRDSLSWMKGPRWCESIWSLASWEINGRPVVLIMEHKLLALKMALALKEASHVQQLLYVRGDGDVAGKRAKVRFTGQIMNEPKGGVYRHVDTRRF